MIAISKVTRIPNECCAIIKVCAVQWQECTAAVELEIQLASTSAYTAIHFDACT